jgi:pyridoxamine 5'-phosphate oxidase
MRVKLLNTILQPRLLAQTSPRTSTVIRTMSSTHVYAESAPPQPPRQPLSTDSVNTGPSTVHLTTHNQYKTPRLLPNHLNPNPLLQFNKWLAEALSPTPESGMPPVREPEAMAVSSVSSEGIPSTRVVLLKTVDEQGFVFFTNYNSRKSQELLNGYASLAFYWKETSRQIRVVGRVEKVSRQESEEYFHSRPLGSQVGAWASPQSSVVDEDTLEKNLEEAKAKFGDNVPCPPHWGGWRIIPL